MISIFEVGSDFEFILTMHTVFVLSNKIRFNVEFSKQSLSLPYFSAKKIEQER